MADNRIKRDDWIRNTHPPKNGLYERLYAEHLGPTIEEFRDGVWRSINTGRACGMQSKPWRPIEKVKA